MVCGVESGFATLQEGIAMNTTAMIILADGFEEVEAITPIDLLRRAGVKISLVGLSSLMVTGSHNITINVESTLGPVSSLPDALILPGGPGHKHLLDSVSVIELVKKMYSADKLCAAICAAPAVFGKAGILLNKRATCFPGDESKLLGAVFAADPVVVDGNVITSRGAGTAVPFALAIVTYLAGKEKAGAVSRAIVYG
jgi:4-methyl-5(b-hydroxyethyl)-thiazole monophosphate biosynthesis